MHEQKKKLLKLEVIGIIIQSFKNFASIKNLYHIYSILASYTSKKKQRLEPSSQKGNQKLVPVRKGQISESVP